MRTICAKSLAVISVAVLGAYADGECKEIQKEMKKLQNLKSLIEKKIDENKKLLQDIRQERQALQDLNQSIQKEMERIRSDRIKKLAKDFESMDPEYAGEKLSRIEDPKIAAYILYNMNSRKAGEALNYVSAEAVSKITQILTKLKRDNEKK